MANSCCFCSSKSLHPLFTAVDIQRKSFEFVKCSTCGTAQLKSFDHNLLNYAYHAEYYGGVNAKFKFPFDLLFKKSKKVSASYISKHLSSNTAQILDIGCGRAGLLKELHQLGYKNLHGNDIERPSSLPNYVQFKEGNFTRNTFARKRFDFISLFHVFEHLPEPKSILETLTEVILPKGYLYLTIPNVDSYQCEKYQANWFHLDPPRHLHLIPPQQIIDFVQTKGFELIEFQTNFLSYNVIGYTQSALNSMGLKRDYFYEFLKKGHKVKSLKGLLSLLFSFIYTSISFPFYAVLDKKHGKEKNSGTIGLLFQKA